jgi:hypothetical protein
LEEKACNHESIVLEVPHGIVEVPSSGYLASSNAEASARVAFGFRTAALRLSPIQAATRCDRFQ